MLRRFSWLVFAGTLLLTVAPLQAQEPADSAIKGALQDIERFEEQVKGLAPNQQAGIKRVTRLLGLTEERLNGSSNQSDPSWIAANDRLTALKQALSDLAAGKTPSAAPQPAETAPASTASPSKAPTSADPTLAAAETEIARLDGLIDQTGASDRALIKRHRLQLNQVADKLNAVADKSTPDFNRVAQAYNTTNSKLNALIEAANSGTATAPSSSQPAAQSGGADPDVGRAQREMTMIDRQVGSMRDGDARLADRFLKDLARIDQDLDAVADKSGQSWSDADAQHAALVGTIVGKRAQGIQAELGKLVDWINSFQPLQYLIAEPVGQARNGVINLQANLDALGTPDNPAVQQVAGNIAHVSQAFEDRVQAAEAEHAKLGDVKGKLAAVYGRARDIGVPATLVSPITEADVQAYAEGVARLRQHVGTDLAYLQSIDGKTPLTIDEQNTYRAVTNELAYSKPQALETSLSGTAYAIDYAVSEPIRIAEFYGTLDPSDYGDRANNLIGKGVFEENMAKLAAGREAIKAAILFDQGIGRTDGPDRQAQSAQLESGIVTYEEKRRIALDTIRMPEATSDDADFLAAAETLLTGPDYGHSFERMVINYGPKRKEKTTGDIELDSVSASGTVSGTATLYEYVWDEFQVTTAEKDGDAYYLVANRLRYYIKGGPSTPTDQWILTDRFQGSQILEENIHKD